MNKVSTAEAGTNGCSSGFVEVNISDEICFQFVIQVKKTVDVEIKTWLINWAILFIVIK